MLRPSCFSLLLVAFASLAQAQSPPPANKPPSKSVIAEALFREGKKLLEAGDIEQACPKLEASQSTEPALGTLLVIGLCYERSGRFASAWTTFSSAASQAAAAGRKDRERYARERVAVLEKQLHRVKFDAKLLPANGAMTLDGQPLSREVADTALPLDPGSHSLVASAPGHADWSTTFAVPNDAGLDVVEIPELVPRESPPETPPPPRVAPKPATKPKLRSPERPNRAAPPLESSDRRTIGYMVGGVGLASLVVSGFFTYRMLDQKSVRDELCPPGKPCHDQAAVDADRSARSARTFAIAFGAASAVGLGVGAWLVLGESRSTAAVVTPTGDLAIWGRF